MAPAKVNFPGSDRPPMPRASTTRSFLARVSRWLAGLLAAGIVLLLGTTGALAAGRVPSVSWIHSPSRQYAAVYVDQRGKLVLANFDVLAERCLTRAGARELRRRLRAVAALPAKVVVISPHPGRKGDHFDRLTVSWRGHTHHFEDLYARRHLPLQVRRLISLLARFVRSQTHQLWIRGPGHQQRPRPICHEQI